MGNIQGEYWLFYITSPYTRSNLIRHYSGWSLKQYIPKSINQNIPCKVLSKGQLLNHLMLVLRPRIVGTTTNALTVLTYTFWENNHYENNSTWIYQRLLSINRLYVTSSESLSYGFPLRYSEFRLTMEILHLKSAEHLHNKINDKF